jgi:hypothetical protein
MGAELPVGLHVFLAGVAFAHEAVKLLNPLAQGRLVDSVPACSS